MMKRISIFLLTIFSLAGLAAQSDIKGEIIYLEGEVNISRRGEMLPFNEVDMGLLLEEEDVIKTGFDGYMEIELTYPGQGSLLKVQPDTVFYFDKRENSGRSTARVNLLGGSIGLKVSKLTSNESMNVETQSAVMGIRGTEFDVNRAVTGEILVTCNEGKVSCATPAMETFSLPGTVCLQDDGKDFVNDNVSVTELDNYKNRWWNARMEALTTLGPLSVEYYTGRFDSQIILFDSAWNELKDNDMLFKEYESILADGSTPSRAKATRDKMTLTSSVIKMRSALPLMEEVFYTLQLLKEYQSRNVFDGDSRDFREFSRRENSLESRLVQARYYLSLYGKVSAFAAGGSNSTLNSMLSN